MRVVMPLEVIETVAATQHGVVTAAQCRTAGVEAALVKRLCRSRQWLRLNEGAYLVNAPAWGTDPPRRALVSAAVLSAGPHAVAVLATAAELHGLAGLRRDDTVHVSMPPALARPRRCTEPGVRLHQLVIRPDEITTVDGIRLTTPADR